MTDLVPDVHSTATITAAREVKAWMARLGYRQADIAQLLGIAQGQVSARLRGRIQFTLEQLMIIAAEFEISLGDLLGERIINEKRPRPAKRDEGFQELPRLDSNQQPFD
ncbi:helix-turn-helix domain-containing protein [Citricoccus sp. NR2]|uniref:helix-turn-helix domain-containing protein n=1 Tax=Citricoccus sp. NR2 TaxID=3004095 RepID=UPI003FA47C06